MIQYFTKSLVHLDIWQVFQMFPFTHDTSEGQSIYVTSLETQRIHLREEE